VELNETQDKSIERAKNLIKLLLMLEEMGEPTAKEIEDNSWRGVCSDGVEYLY
jgi:hypothetical protein